MKKKLFKYCLILLVNGFSILNAIAENIYPLSDISFANSLLAIDPSLVNDQNELLIDNIVGLNITELDLSNKEMSNVDGIQYFTQLETLNISENQLIDLPSLSPLIQLKNVNVSNNLLSRIDDVFKDMKALSVLDISFNELLVFPTFHIDVSLMELYVNNNKLTGVTNFTKCNGLRVLDLSYNNIVDLQEFTIIDFPVLDEIDIKGNRLYYDDFYQYQTNVLNQWEQQKVTIVVPDTVYIGDTLRLDLGFDTHESNFHVLINRPEYFELADSYTEELEWPIIDTSQGGVYHIQTSNSFYTNDVFLSNEFSFVVVEKPFVPPVLPPVVEPIDPFPPVVKEPEKHYQSELIPDGLPEEQTIFLDGIGRAMVYDKSGNVYNKLDLPIDWDGKGSKGEIVPGYYLIRLSDTEMVKITIIY